MYLVDTNVIVGVTRGSITAADYLDNPALLPKSETAMWFVVTFVNRVFVLERRST